MPQKLLKTKFREFLLILTLSLIGVLVVPIVLHVGSNIVFENTLISSILGGTIINILTHTVLYIKNYSVSYFRFVLSTLLLSACIYISVYEVLPKALFVFAFLGYGFCILLEITIYKVLYKIRFQRTIFLFPVIGALSIIPSLFDESYTWVTIIWVWSSIAFTFAIRYNDIENPTQ